jgi:hypothetical protein
MDIIKDLWPDFVKTYGATLREELGQRFGLTITPENSKLIYDIGGDTGRIQIKTADEWKTVGEVTTDYSEPCLKYVIYV